MTTTDQTASYSRKHKVIGPGGLKCSCCAPVKVGQRSKRFINRLVRREDRALLKNLV